MEYARSHTFSLRLLFLLGLFVVGVLVFRQPTESTGPEIQPTHLDLVSVGDLQVRTPYYQPIGTVEASDPLALSFVIDGRVAEVLAAPGAEVVQGEPVVTLENWLLVDKLREAESAFEEVVARYDSAVRDGADDIAALEEEVRAARLRVFDLEQRVGRTILTAPVAGTLESMEVVPGDRVKAGQLVATLGSDVLRVVNTMGVSLI